MVLYRTLCIIVILLIISGCRTTRHVEEKRPTSWGRDGVVGKLETIKVIDYTVVHDGTNVRLKPDSSRVITYDVNGDRLSVDVYDANDLSDRYVYEMHVGMNTIEETVFNRDSELYENIVYGYNNDGKMTHITTRISDYKECDKRQEFIYNEKGTVAEIHFYENNELQERHELRYKTRDKVISEQVFNAAGELVSYIRYLYYTNDRKIEKIEYAADKQTVKKGYVYYLNTDGNVREESIYDYTGETGKRLLISQREFEYKYHADLFSPEKLKVMSEKAKKTAGAIFASLGTFVLIVGVVVLIVVAVLFCGNDYSFEGIW